MNRGLFMPFIKLLQERPAAADDEKQRQIDRIDTQVAVSIQQIGQHRARQMRRCAIAKRRVAHRARRRLGPGLEIGQGLDAALRMGTQHMLRQTHQRHRTQILHAVIGQLLDQGLVGGEAVGHGDQAVSIRRCVGHAVHADHGARARLVLHHHRLTDRRGQLGRHQTGHDVRRPAGRKWHHDAHGPRRPGLRARQARQQRERRDSRQGATAGNKGLHGMISHEPVVESDAYTPQCGMWCAPSDTATFLGSQKTS